MEDESHGSTEEVQRRAAGAGDADGGGAAAGPGDERRGRSSGSLTSSGMHPRGVAELGPAGRDRRRCPAGHHAATTRSGSRELEREDRELRRANEILRTAVGVFRGGGARPQDQVADRCRPAVRASTTSTPTATGRRGRELGVEPICAVLREAGVQIAPSTYYAAKTRPPSARAVRDAELVEEITRCTPGEPGCLRRPEGPRRAQPGRHQRSPAAPWSG